MIWNGSKEDDDKRIHSLKDSLKGACVEDVLTDEEDTCRMHCTLISVLTSLSDDIRWMVRLSKWFLYTAGGLLAIVFPLIVAFTVYVHDLNAKVATIEARQIIVMTTLKDQGVLLIQHITEDKGKK